MRHVVVIPPGKVFAPQTCLQVSSPTFSPASLTGLTLWLDAQNAASIHLTSGKVSQWDDQSGHANNATEPTAAARPSPGTGINGHPTVDFLKANNTQMTLAVNWSSLVTAAAWTIVAEWLYTGTDNVSGGDSRTMPSLITDGNGLPSPAVASGAGLNGAGIVSAQGFSFDGAGTNRVTSSTGSSTSPHSSTVQLDGAGHLTAALDSAGANSVNVGTTVLDATPVLIGGNNQSTSGSWNGSIGEILVYNRALTAGEIAQVQSYLLAKWS